MIMIIIIFMSHHINTEEFFVLMSSRTEKFGNDEIAEDMGIH
jgi:hypothetical protein